MDHFNTTMYWNKLLSLFVLMIVNAKCCQHYSWNPYSSQPKLHFTILILARGGSKGIKLKNLAKVGGLPLLRIALKNVKKASEIDSVWVSTDHLKISQEAAKENINIHWRSPESASDSATSIDGVKEFLYYHQEIDILGLVQCTSPFINEKYLQNAIDLMRNGKECVFSVTRSYKLLWKESSNLAPINFDPKFRPRRQDWTGNLVENGMFYFATRKLLENGLFQSNSHTADSYSLRIHV